MADGNILKTNYYSKQLLTKIQNSTFEVFLNMSNYFQRFVTLVISSIYLYMLLITKYIYIFMF